MSQEFMRAIWGRREFMGMRSTVATSLVGLMTCLRVLPEYLYRKVMETNEEVPEGSVFEEIVQRCRNPTDYEKAPIHMMHGGM